MRAGRNGHDADGMQPVHKLERGGLVAAGKGGNVFSQFEAEHKAEAPRTFHNCGIFPGEPVQFMLQPFAELPRVGIQLFRFDHFQDFQRHSAGQRRAAEGGTVRAGSEQAGIRFANPERADGEAAAERFRHGEAVGQKVFAAGHAFENPLETLELAGAIMAALNAVHEQQYFFLIAQGAQAQEIFGGGGRHAAFALHAFDHDGGGGGRDGGPGGLEVIERNVPEAGHDRLEAFFHLVLAGRGDAAERPSVKRIDGGKHFKAAFVVTEFARELEETFIRLRAAVGKKTFAGADPFHEFRGQPALRFGEIEIGDVDELLRLLHQRGGDGRVRVAEAAHGDAAAEIQVAAAGHVKQIAARPVAEDEFEATVAGHNVACEQFADGLVLIAHDGRRSRFQFFH